MKRSTASPGDTHHDLTYLGEAEPKIMPSGGRKFMAQVRCKCGKVYVVQWNNLSSGKCRRCVTCAARQRPGRPKRSVGDSVNRKQAMRAYQRNARERGLSWELTPEIFDKLTSQACIYCSAPPSNTYHLKNPDGTPRVGDAFIYNGIDRVDSSLGYTPENTVPCCRPCNVAKNTQTLPEFIAWAVRLSHTLQDHENGTSVHARTVFSEEVWRDARMLSVPS